jgi:hypothetical protein
MALAAQTHLAEWLTLKLWFTKNVEQSLIVLIGECTLSESNMEEQLICF